MKIKKCPFCHKQISDEAILCKYCHSLLINNEDDDAEDIPDKTRVFKRKDIDAKKKTKVKKKTKIITLMGLIPYSIPFFLMGLIKSEFKVDEEIMYSLAMYSMLIGVVATIVNICRIGFFKGIGISILRFFVSLLLGFTLGMYSYIILIILVIKLLGFLTGWSDYEDSPGTFVPKSDHMPYEVNIDKPYGGRLTRNEYDNTYRDSFNDEYDVDGYYATNKTTGEVYNIK